MITHPGTHEEPPSGNKWLKPLAIGGLVASTAIILAPYVLPSLGIGSNELTIESATIMHGPGAGSGIAGSVNSVLEAVPGIGTELAKGGLVTSLVSGVVGIGGILLGNYIQKKDDGTRRFNYGKIIKTAALITSALIALPSVLSGISVGLVYLCGALGDHTLATAATGLLTRTIGCIGSSAITAGASTGALAAAIPHIATCGAAILPAAITYGMSSDLQKPDASFESRLHPHHHIEQNPYTDGTIVSQIITNGPCAPGKRCEAILKLTHKSTGLPITRDELAVNFTEKMHLFVVDQSLKDYHHIHPTATATPGEYAFSFTPNTPNAYNAWTDITLLRDDKNHRLKSTLPCALERNVRAYVSTNTQTSNAGLNFTWKTTAPLRKDTPSIVEVTITDKNGLPMTDLQPVMGAFAHLVGFSADGKSIIHTHPLGADPKNPADRGGPKLRFHVEPDFTGPVQFYLQVKSAGKDVYASFGQQIAPPSLNTQKLPIFSSSHGPHASLS